MEDIEKKIGLLGTEEESWRKVIVADKFGASEFHRNSSV